MDCCSGAAVFRELVYSLDGPFAALCDGGYRREAFVESAIWSPARADGRGDGRRRGHGLTVGAQQETFHLVPSNYSSSRRQR